jgi:AraC-like DNA-binding protein/ligand-binding sensor protein
VKDKNQAYQDNKAVLVYMRSTGTNVQIFDGNFKHIENDEAPGVEQTICRNCTNSTGCREMHINAIKESSTLGRAHIYQCALGLMFWVCPMFRDGKFSGALRGSGFLCDKADNATLAEKCSGAISPEEFVSQVSAFPLCSMEKIQSLAEMLLLCAESLSCGADNHHEKLRLYTEQQTSLSVLIEELKKQYPEGTALPGYPLDQERLLMDALNRGEKKEADKLLNGILAILIFSNPDNFRYIQLRAMELAVLFARTGRNSTSNAAMETNVRCLKQIQDAKTIEELTGVLHYMVDFITGQIISFQGIPHVLALQKAEIYIRENFTHKIKLREVAKIAGLSAPYFSTIFKEEMGENLSRYINRLRVEKSIKMLLETEFTLNEISNACCFQDQSWYTKIFKSFTGISPGKYRSQGGLLFTQRKNAE